MTRLNKSFSNCAGQADAVLKKIYLSFSQQNKLGINFNFSLTTKAGSIHNTRLMDETIVQETRVEDRPWALRPGDKNLSCDTSRKNSATLPMVQRRWSPGPWARPSAAAAPPSPRETEIVNTSDTLLSTASSCFYITTVSGNFLKSSTKLTRYPADYKFHCSSQLNLNRTILNR